MKDSKATTQKEIDRMKDPKKQAEAAIEFNKDQLKDLLQIAKEEGVKLNPKIAKQFLIEKAGSRPVDSSNLVVSMLQKQSNFKRKKIQLTAKQNEEIDRILRGEN